MMFQFPNFKKAQSTIEFVILVMAVLFFFVIFLIFVQGKIASKNYESVSVALYETAVSIQEEINLATSSSDGYFRQFTIQNNINGILYYVNITEGSVYARTTNGKHALILPVSYAEGDVVLGSNYITKVNGVVYLNP